MTLVQWRAYDGVQADTNARFALIGIGTKGTIIAGGAIGLYRITATRNRIAGTSHMALIKWCANNGGSIGAYATLASIISETLIAGIACSPIGSVGIAAKPRGGIAGACQMALIL